MTDTNIVNAVFGDWVYFKEDYDEGSITIPAGMGARVRNELSQDREFITNGYHTVDIDFEGRYYEIEVPFEVLGMQ